MTRASALDAAARAHRPPEPAAPETESSPHAAPPPADRRLSDSNQAWLGKIVDGRYRVLEVIGRGGMGVVYRVEHLRMGKVAAMKVVHRDLASDPEVVARFEREAAAVSKLHHPHTVQVFDFGAAQGALYLIMEYVRGQDLAHVIERDGPMPWHRAGPLFAQICGALQEAHELGIVHRDLKPENVLITRTTGGRDYVKVLDFGLAKLDPARAPTTATERQQVVGTPYFMSPEQIRGEEVDARSDIYSLGCLMFEMLTAQHLFVGSTAVGVLTKHLTAEPDAPSNRARELGLDPRVDHLVRRALAKSPRDRWQSAAELGDAVEDAYAETVGDATGSGVRVSRGLAGGRLVVPLEDHADSNLRLRRSDIDAFERALRRRRWLGLVTAAIVVAGAASALAWWALREPGPLHEEREPNDDLAHANRIADRVTGYLGKRLSTSEGDRDVFVVNWPSSSRHVVTVRVTAIPNLDIKLTIGDADGHTTTADEGRIGDDEIVHRRGIDGPLVVTVAQTVAKGMLPVENVSDAYTLTITEEPAEDAEVEPNGNDADATPIAPTRELRGYLDTRDDVDVLRWTGGDGTFVVTVRAGEGLPLQWRAGDGKARTPGETKLALHRGELIRLERGDRGGTGALAGRDAMWSITIVPAP
jgi:serine/threonine-protein kinase